MKILKILHVTPFFPPDIGGLPNHVENIVLGSMELGHDVHVISPKRFGEKSVSVPHVKNITRINSFYLPGWPYSTLRKISIPFDFGYKIKKIIQNNDFDLIHVHGHHYPFSYIAINSAYKKRIPVILTLHGLYGLNPHNFEGRTKIEDVFNEIIFKRILQKTTGVIVLSKKVFEHAKKYGNDSTQYFTVSNGVDTKKFKENISQKKKFREKYCLKNNSTVVLFSGRFEKGKKIIEFAKAAKTLVQNNPNVEILIAGSGALESELKTTLHGVPRTHILDWQPQETMHEVYIASDIFIIPSVFEAQPITVIEAMNAGLHIVYSDVGGILDTIADYPFKTVLHNLTSQGILDALNEVTENFFISENLDSALKYAQEFDLKKVTNKTIHVYEKCFENIFG